MGYWIYMTCVSLLVPIIILFIGSSFRKTVPKEINTIFGYRTERSMKNWDTWEYANLLFGKLAFRLGWGMMAVTAIIMLFTIFHSENVVTIVTLTVITLQIFPLLGIIPIVEKSLKKTFNEDGSRK